MAGVSKHRAGPAPRRAPFLSDPYWKLMHMTTDTRRTFRFRLGEGPGIEIQVFSTAQWDDLQPIIDAMVTGVKAVGGTVSMTYAESVETEL